jgi:hypothetical protein
MKVTLEKYLTRDSWLEEIPSIGHVESKTRVDDQLT